MQCHLKCKYSTKRNESQFREHKVVLNKDNRELGPPIYMWPYYGFDIEQYGYEY